MSVMHHGVDIACDAIRDGYTCAVWEHVNTESVHVARRALQRKGWRRFLWSDRMTFIDCCPECARRIAAAHSLIGKA